MLKWCCSVNLSELIVTPISQSKSRLLSEEKAASVLWGLDLRSVRLCWESTGVKVEVKAGSGGIWTDSDWFLCNAAIYVDMIDCVLHTGINVSMCVYTSGWQNPDPMDCPRGYFIQKILLSQWHVELRHRHVGSDVIRGEAILGDVQSGCECWSGSTTVYGAFLWLLSLSRAVYVHPLLLTHLLMYLSLFNFCQTCNDATILVILDRKSTRREEIRHEP